MISDILIIFSIQKKIYLFGLTRSLNYSLKPLQLRCFTWNRTKLYRYARVVNAAKIEKSTSLTVESIMIRDGARFTVRVCSFACGSKAKAEGIYRRTLIINWKTRVTRPKVRVMVMLIAKIMIMVMIHNHKWLNAMRDRQYRSSGGIPAL